MRMFAGLDVGFKRTSVCVVDETGKIVWRGVVDTHPEIIAAALRRWRGELAKVGLESGSMSPWLARALGAMGFAVVLFLAGHGENVGAHYLFIPEDAEDLESGKYRPSTVVKWSVLQQALQGSLAGIRIMFIDTWHSRGAYNQRLIKDAADANIVVFSATDSATEAQEDANLGHGIFTYALAEGLNGKADLMKKGAISIGALYTFVSDEVKDLSKGEQEPTFIAAFAIIGMPCRVYPSFVYATQIAEVEVDTETGEVVVLRVVAAHDAGTITNPMLLEGQIAGGIAQGIGMALTEEVTLREGRTLNPGLMDYTLPSTLDVPEIQYCHVQTSDQAGPYGAKCVGEPALVPTAPAILNAIYDATGVRIYDLPATPEKILRAIEAAAVLPPISLEA